MAMKKKQAAKMPAAKKSAPKKGAMKKANGLTPAQKKLPPFLQKAIMNKKKKVK